MNVVVEKMGRVRHSRLKERTKEPLFILAHQVWEVSVVE
jgi:hypothetical protein